MESKLARVEWINDREAVLKCGTESIKLSDNFMPPTHLGGMRDRINQAADAWAAPLVAEALNKEKLLKAAVIESQRKQLEEATRTIGYLTEKVMFLQGGGVLRARSEGGKPC